MSSGSQTSPSLSKYAPPSPTPCHRQLPSCKPANNRPPAQAFHPSAQTAFHKALTDIDDTATAATSTTDAVVPPDVAVAFRLYRDSGRLINLADWWSAFEQAAVDEEEGAEEVAKAGGKRKPGGSDDGMEVDEEDEDGEDDEDDNPRRRKQARFLRAVADLAHAGYVQPTSRKVEHVGKTIF